MIQIGNYKATIEWEGGLLRNSRTYRLTICRISDGKVCINQGGFTESGAKTHFNRWVANQQKK